jgi:hypothetical protein
MIRHAWIGGHADVTQKRHCVVFVESDEMLKRLIDEEYTRHPFFGSRKMAVNLGICEHRVNRQACATLHAIHVAGRYGARTKHQQGAPAAQGLPLFAAWRSRGAGQSGLEH